QHFAPPVFGWDCCFEGGEAVQDGIKNLPDLHACQLVSGTCMGAESEAQVGFTLAGKVELFGVLKDRLVEVGGVDNRMDSIVLLHGHATDLNVLRCDADAGTGS